MYIVYIIIVQVAQVGVCGCGGGSSDGAGLKAIHDLTFKLESAGFILKYCSSLQIYE